MEGHKHTTHLLNNQTQMALMYCTHSPLHCDTGIRKRDGNHRSYICISIFLFFLFFLPLRNSYILARISESKLDANIADMTAWHRKVKKQHHALFDIAEVMA